MIRIYYSLIYFVRDAEIIYNDSFNLVSVSSTQDNLTGCLGGGLHRVAGWRRSVPRPPGYRAVDLGRPCDKDLASLGYVCIAAINHYCVKYLSTRFVILFQFNESFVLVFTFYICTLLENHSNEKLFIPISIKIKLKKEITLRCAVCYYLPTEYLPIHVHM